MKATSLFPLPCGNKYGSAAENSRGITFPESKPFGNSDFFCDVALSTSKKNSLLRGGSELNLGKQKQGKAKPWI